MTDQISPFDIAAIVTNLLVAVTAFYAAWMNLFLKRISKFGFDVFILFIVNLFDKKQTQKIRKDPTAIKRMGYMMLLFGIGCVWALVTN